ncbi:sodium-coupled monocarboxylate transporter 2-like [Macrosteles quadrilineatus]|uniref:sodium-coupled monocarboxylate transporter 2-like n=1 Tax=Macrosteles quadrilineatus TaxID=74068 RepID=UPI0023E0B25D|nr:sodium-coupled monocarboxylate transporter 2-like [Macrosteles quadrilineatus]
MFAPEEYAVVLLMLVLSLVIGVYFTFWSRQDNYTDYMLGGRSMGVFPVAMSQVASHISGIAIVGTPAETYSYGSLFAVGMIADLIVPFINIALFLPIFYNLQLKSLFEYLELRFSHSVRVLGSLIFTISQIVYLPAIIYVPALIFNQVSGMPVQAVAPIICAICIFYTTFGGLKAVLWTDAFQNLFSLIAVLCVMFLGVYRVGGVAEIHRINLEGGREEFFIMELSPFVRSSFWTILIGNMMNWMCNLAVHPGAVQRCLSVPTLSKAKRVLLWTSFGVFFVHGLVIYLGMILYARYYGCDPIATGEVKKTGQLVPLFVMEVTKGYPGLAGLFVSGVLSAALSSMSSSLNTMTGSIYEDLVEFCFRGHKLSDVTQSYVMKCISLLLGVLCTSLVLLVEKTDSIFQRIVWWRPSVHFVDGLV